MASTIRLDKLKELAGPVRAMYDAMEDKTAGSSAWLDWKQAQHSAAQVFVTQNLDRLVNEYELPPLTGSERQIAWAEKIRKGYVRRVFKRFLEERFELATFGGWTEEQAAKKKDAIYRRLSTSTSKARSSSAGKIINNLNLMK